MSIKQRSSSPDTAHKSLVEGSSKNISLKVYIVHTKIDGDTALELYNLLHSQQTPGLEQCANVADADIIITNIRMRRRLERHVDWMVAVSYNKNTFLILARINTSNRCKRWLLLQNGFRNQ